MGGADASSSSNDTNLEQQGYLRSWRNHLKSARHAVKRVLDKNEWYSRNRCVDKSECGDAHADNLGKWAEQACNECGGKASIRCFVENYEESELTACHDDLVKCINFCKNKSR